MRKLAIVSATIVLSLIVIAGACTRPASAPVTPPQPKPSPPAAAPSPPKPPAPAPTPAAKPPPAPAPAPKAVSAADFYRDNALTIIVNTSAGGGTDYAGRLFASFWPDVAGGPAKVKNITGGGGSLGLNEAANTKPDGLTIVTAVMGFHVIMPWLLKAPAVRYDPRKFIMLGSPVREVSILSVSSKLPYKSVKEIPKDQPFKVATSSLYSTTSLDTVIAFEALGLEKASIVSGFAGTIDTAVSAGKGESHGLVASQPGTAQFKQQGYTRPLAILEFEKIAWFPDVPALPQEVKLTAQQEKDLRASMNIRSGFGLFFATPGVPADRVEFVRNAFLKMSQLAGYKQMYALQWPVFDAPMSGKDLTARIEPTFTLSPEDVSRYVKLIERYGATAK